MLKFTAKNHTVHPDDGTPHKALHSRTGSLLFGPFAAIGPKFLKYGSNMDLFKSIKTDNLLTLVSAGIKNLPLVKYSIQQVMMRKADRMKELRKFVPDAKVKTGIFISQVNGYRSLKIQRYTAKALFSLERKS